LFQSILSLPINLLHAYSVLHDLKFEEYLLTFMLVINSMK